MVFLCRVLLGFDAMKSVAAGVNRCIEDLRYLKVEPSRFRDESALRRALLGLLLCKNY